MAVTNAYLDESVRRLVEMWREALREFGEWRVVNYVDTGMVAPLVWLYPGIPRMTQLSFEADVQVYAVNARVILGKEDRYDGEMIRVLWRLLPAVVNYFLTHKRLTYKEDMEPPPYLSAKGVYFQQLEPFGTFVGSSDVGIELQHVLPFLVKQEQFKE